MQKGKKVMDTYKEIGKLLSSNEYPGRGIILGTSPDGTKAVAAYFIMGRSENSRNRIFEKRNDEIYTKAFDESKMEDPSLIIYAAVRKSGNNLIVTNGDQTDTIYDFLESGKSFEEALETREFEPDAPNFTSRISGVAVLDKDSYRYNLSILKALDKDGSSCGRFVYGYEKAAGIGHFIHTYRENGSPLPAFEGEPVAIATGDSAREFAEYIWGSLNNENKISLYVRYTDIETGEYTETLINKNGQEAASERI